MSEKHQTALIAQQVDALLYHETHNVSNLANAAALLKDSLPNISWAGFYLYDQEQNDLYLGPFAGKVACMHIALGKGVCGTAFSTQQTQIVPDVHQFAGHIACDSATNSEMVVPLIKKGQPIGVLDLDSLEFDRFSSKDQNDLEEFAHALVAHLTI
ncbi:GAF domain-containing protein [Loigolactobacillus backii]|uniref:Histidine kinase n=1 Tax=Loigolactobacillus backii TaxID=375175 RepID=A0A192H471_9LACO|nr:GAF domain-containing protein [Loigolactobacillus backii]ANK59768.1 histidine kinase [Loigolactobacillus backii]ANK63170.1 histidine kinase [Loigolactobacillus backii]ANK64763.1 histidine kinase [Loigolactobacillus backii]ANK66788.1 histidine kinase [Loigolactobacillus backii]ANK69824.1 histidine kinase [Loigolactobacillus backii]